MVWSSYLGAYVASQDCSLQGGSHFYFSTSTDLLSWSTPQTLYQQSDLPANVSSLVTAMTYPTFLDPAAPERGDINFGSMGQSAWLAWVSIGHSPYSDGRRLWATPLTFTRK
jgi:hypothetical protein